MTRKVYIDADGIHFPDMDASWTERNSFLKNVFNEQSAKADYGKAKLSLVPRRIIWDVAAIREYGNNKYPNGGPDNWKTVDVQRYRDAAYRHFLRYLDSPDSLDDESGFPHLWHLACNIAFLCEMEDVYLSKNPKVVDNLRREFAFKFKEGKGQNEISWQPVVGKDERIEE